MAEEVGERERKLAELLDEYAKQNGMKFGKVVVEAQYQDGKQVTLRVAAEKVYKQVK